MIDAACYQSLLNLHPDGLLVLDRDRTILEANVKARELLGFEPKGRPLEEVLGTKNTQEGLVEAGFRKLLDQPFFFHCPKEENGGLQLVILRPDSDDEDERERSRLERILDSLPEPIAVQDSLGNYYYVNADMEKLTGLSKTKLLKEGWRAISISIQEYIPLMERVEQGLSDHEECEQELTLPDGRHRIFRVVYTPISYHGQRRVLTSVIDITELKAQQDYLNALLELLPVGMFSFDLETSRIFSANPLLQDLLGYSQEELTRMTPFELLPEELHKEATERIQRTLMTGERDWLRWRMLKKDGSWLPVMISYGKVYDPCIQKDIMAAFVVDVSESERAMAFIERAVEIMPVGFLLADVETGRCLESNEAFLKMTDYSMEELSHKSWIDITPQEMVAKELEENQHLKAPEGTIIRREKEFLRKDGTRVPVILYFGSVFDPRRQENVYLVYAVDISEIKEAQAEIEKERAYWRLLFDNAPMGVVVYDMDGRYTEVNGAFCEMAGVGKEELLDPNFNWRELFRERLEETVAQVNKVHETGLNVTGELLISGRNGNKKTPVLSTTIPLPWQDEKGRPLQAAFHQDITPLKEAQEKLEELVEAQQQTIKEISTPIIPVLSRVLMAPLLGSFDSMRMHDLSERLLEYVASQKPKAVLLDLTGLAHVDTQVISEIIRLITSLRLIGSRAILVGIKPHVAQSLVRLGANLEGVPTHATLEQGLRGLLRDAGHAKG